MIVPHKSFRISYSSEQQRKAIERLLKTLKSGTQSIHCKTSGSTGTPKQIKLTKNALVASAKNTIEFFNLKPKQTATLCMSVDFIAGKMILVRAMLAGMHLHVVPVKADLSEDLMPCDFLALFPKQIQGLLEQKKGIETLKKCKSILVGGAILSESVEARLIENEISVYQSYGMTETVTHVALKRAGFSKDNLYRAISGVSFGIKDACLTIHYPKIQKEPFETTDLVELHDSFSFKWLGRADFVINTGGFKVSPEQIESKLIGLFREPFMLVGVPDAEFGEKIGLILTSSEQSQSIVKNLFIDSVHPYEIPKAFTYINKLAYTDNGKLDRVQTALKTKKSVWKNIL